MSHPGDVSESYEPWHPCCVLKCSSLGESYEPQVSEKVPQRGVTKGTQGLRLFGDAPVVAVDPATRGVRKVTSLPQRSEHRAGIPPNQQLQEPYPGVRKGTQRGRESTGIRPLNPLESDR